MSLDAAKFQEQKIFLFKNDYFKVHARTRFNSPNMAIEIIRRDTLEDYGYFSSKPKDKQEMILQAQDFIEQRKLTKPEDWRAPHRACIAYCTRIEADRDNMSYASTINSLDSDVWWRYLTIRLLKETVLVKKINALSFEERKQLLIVKDWEVKNDSNFRVQMGIFLREYLYRRLFNKEGLEVYHKAYIDWLTEYTERNSE